jgi:hypothetical protein
MATSPCTRINEVLHPVASAVITSTTIAFIVDQTTLGGVIQAESLTINNDGQIESGILLFHNNYVAADNSIWATNIKRRRQCLALCGSVLQRPRFKRDARPPDAKYIQAASCGASVSS